MTPVVFPPTPPSPTLKGPDDTALRQAAVAFEASFLAEMLNAAGLGKTRMSFGGCTGEDQFASFLVQEQATQMARAGGIGLAESIFQALKARDDE